MIVEKGSPATGARLSLSALIFIGLGAGLAAGLFFGEMVAFLNTLGKAWIRLLQMTVLPYVILSLISGLARLTYAEALLLAKRGGVMLLLLWVITLAVVFLFPYTFPDWESSSFFSTSLLDEKSELDFLGLYIPANPFHALANNLVPAVVLFSMAIGVAMIGIEDKARTLEGMAVLIDALTRITNFVVKLTPIGVFALTASAAGTMSLGEFQRLEIYIWSYIGLSLVMSLWVLPGLVTALTPLTYREILSEYKDALVTAFATSSLFVVLPILVEKSKAMSMRFARNKDEVESSVEIIVPASFNFPHAGKLFTLSFVLFAGWYSGYTVHPAQYPALVGTGTASLFANVNMAVPFMLDIMRIPEDMFQLFHATGVVNSRFATLLSAMFTITLTLLGAFSMSGLLTPNLKRLVRYLVITAVLLAATIAGLRAFFYLTIDNSYEKDKVIAEMQLMDTLVQQTVYTEPPPDLPSLIPRGSRLRGIRERGYLRICYRPDYLPFSYFNGSGELVGLDVELAHHLAHNLKLRLEWVPSTFERMAEELNTGYCDIGVGEVMTPDAALTATFSSSYLTLTGAFLVKDYRREQFRSLAEVEQMDGLRIGLPPLSYYVERLQRRLGKATLEVLESPRAFLEHKSDDLDAMVTTAEEAAAWSLLYPAYSVVVPAGVLKVPVAFPLPSGEEELADFLKIWIEIKKNDKTIDQLYDYWVLGKQAKHKTPRWSVIRDVLHWVD